nr:hypothetical protein Iba_chr10eCG10590 [Ipomoea batatas]
MFTNNFPSFLPKIQKFFISIGVQNLIKYKGTVHFLIIGFYDTFIKSAIGAWSKDSAEFVCELDFPPCSLALYSDLSGSDFIELLACESSVSDLGVSFAISVWLGP